MRRQGSAAPFSAGSHDWERRVVCVAPEKPVKQVAMRLLLRRHTGTAWFRNPTLRLLELP